MAVSTYTGPDAAPPYIAKAFLTRLALQRLAQARTNARKAIMRAARSRSLHTLRQALA